MARATMKLLAAVAAVGLLGVTAGCGEVLHAGRVAKLNMEFENLQHDPNFGTIFAELKKDFPQDYEALRTKVITALADLNTEAEMEARARIVALTFVSEFRCTHLGKAAQSSGATLAALASNQLQMLEALRTINPEYCGRLAMGGTATAANPSRPLSRPLPKAAY
ncbi:MAG: hypothetical protein JWP35_2412 [Caulobacter sp.]|nr:hypothetical protein [Caulobacter sp.]